MRTIWAFTGAIVLICGATLVLRAYRAGPVSDAPRPQASPPIATMLSLLSSDPTARNAATRRAVEAVAGRDDSQIAASAEVYLARGILRLGQGNNAGAVDAYTKSTALRPDWSWPYAGLGIALFGLGRTGEAEAMFHKASELEPEWSRPHNDLAVLFRLTGRLDEAEHEALIALRLAPDNVATHNNYGNLLAAQGKLTDAEAEYRRAIELDPDHPSPYYNLACVSARLGNTEMALTQLRKALSLDTAFAVEARHDPDFQSLAGNPAFKALVAEYERPAP